MAFVFAFFVMVCGSCLQEYGLLILGTVLLITAGGGYLSHRKDGKVLRGAWKAFKLSAVAYGALIAIFVISTMTR